MLRPCLRVRSSLFRIHNHRALSLPSEQEHARSKLSKTLSSRMDQLQTSILFAGKRLNDLTGYSGIEKLKIQIDDQEKQVNSCLEAVKAAKQAYKDAVRTRSESQREVNELLQRKSSWSPADLERFTTLFRDDHSAAQAEVSSQHALSKAENDADAARNALGSMILSRYHEEQIWSDKIRRASTWGTWGLMGFNVLLFVLVQLGLEPWKRKRLVGSFEEKVRQVVREERVQEAEAVETEVLDFLTDADYANEPFTHDMPILLEQEAPSGSTAKPLAGTSTLVTLPTNLARLEPHLSVLIQRLRLAFEQMTKMIKKALSDEVCGLRCEEVSAACFASALLGAGLSLSLS